MFTRTDKKSMIIQALMVSPELIDVVIDGLDSEWNGAESGSLELVRECLDKVIEIKSSKPLPPPIPEDEEVYESKPTLFDRIFRNR